MISFAGKVKNELCRVGISRQCCARAEGYGVLLYGNTFTPGEIRIITETSPRGCQSCFRRLLG